MEAEINKGRPEFFNKLVHSFYSLLEFDESETLVRTKIKALFNIDGIDAKSVLIEISTPLKTWQENRQRLTNSNLRLSVKIAMSKKYKISGLPPVQLIGLANAGLFTAVDKFDYHRGYAFASHAAPWIHQAIVRGLKSDHLIHIPEEVLSAGNKDESNDEDLSEREHDKIEKGRHAKRIASADAAHSDDPRSSLHESIVDPNANQIAAVDDRDVVQYLIRKLNRALESVNRRDRNIFKLRFGIGTPNGEPMTLQQIADLNGIKRQRVEQIVNLEIMPKLRKKAADLLAKLKLTENDVTDTNALEDEE
jgi:RNA polymerase primary sigma factor